MNDTKNNNEAARMRRPLMGPGMAMAILLAVFFAWQQYNNTMKRVTPSAPPANASFTQPPGPGIREIIGAADRLELSGEQTARLENLESEWEKESAPVVARLKIASGDFSAYMNSGKDGKKGNISEIRERMAPVSEATAEYAGLKNRYAARALEILDAVQKDKWMKTQKESSGNFVDVNNAKQKDVSAK